MATSSHLDNLLARLERVKPAGNNSWFASCPTAAHQHGDRSRGLHVTLADDGKILAHCFAGCELETVLAAVGLTQADLFPPTGQSYRPSRPRIDYKEVLRALNHEILVVRAIAHDMEKGNLSKPNRERLTLAGSRIQNALMRAGATT